MKNWLTILGVGTNICMKPLYRFSRVLPLCWARSHEKFGPTEKGLSPKNVLFGWKSGSQVHFQTKKGPINFDFFPISGETFIRAFQSPLLNSQISWPKMVVFGSKVSFFWLFWQFLSHFPLRHNVNAAWNLMRHGGNSGFHAHYT